MTSLDVAQLGSALPWGGRGREFKSHRSDHFYETSPKILLKESKIKRGNIYFANSIFYWFSFNDYYYRNTFWITIF